MNRRGYRASGFEAADGEDEEGDLFADDSNEDGDAVLMDKDGNVITHTTEDNQEVNVAAYMEAGVEYAPVVTTDVIAANPDEPGGTDAPSDEANGMESEEWSSSGGGCNAGFGALAFAALAMIISKRR